MKLTLAPSGDGLYLDKKFRSYELGDHEKHEGRPNIAEDAGSNLGILLDVLRARQILRDLHEIRRRPCRPASAS